MAHKTRINGTYYEISGGKTLVNGTAYSIDKGKTLAGSTVYDVGFGTPISSLKVGDPLYFNVNGVRTEFVIVQQGTPTDMSGNPLSNMYYNCDGAWLMMKSIAKTDQLYTNNVNNYSGSYLHTYLSGEFFNSLPLDVRNAIEKQKAKIPYVVTNGKGSVSSGQSGLSAKCFLLSAREVGFMNAPDGSELHNDGVVLEYFTTDATSKRQLSVNWWTRTPAKGWTNMMIMSYANGSVGVINSNLTAGIRPAFILPSDFDVTNYLNP